MAAQTEEQRREKARQMRYKRPMAKAVNLEKIKEDLWEIQGTAQDLQWTDDNEALVAALDGDEDEAFEFRMAFSDLVSEAEQMESDLEEMWVPDCFDTFFPAVGTTGGYMGYDEYEGDYFGLEPWENVYAERMAKEKLSRLTKTQIIEAAGICLRVFQQYIALMYRYDCLKASLDILKSQNEGLLKIVRGIEEQYEIAESDSQGFRFQFGEAIRKFDAMLSNVPDRLWIE